MRIATWNVNSLNVRLPRVEEWIGYAQPDILCLQETKLADAAFPYMAFEALGYEVAHNGSGRWNGVAIVSRVGLDDVVAGFLGESPPLFEAEEQEARLLSATCGGVRVASVYVPNGRALDSEHYAYKLTWFKALRAHLDTHCDPTTGVVVCGDFNVAPEDRDVWDPKKFLKVTHTSQPERAALEALRDWGLVDAFRLLYDQERLFSYWDYRAGDFHQGRGMRIDLVYVSASLAEGRDLGAHRPQRAQRQAPLRPRARDHRHRSSRVTDEPDGDGWADIEQRVGTFLAAAPTAKQAAARRVGTVMRQLIERLVATEAPAESMEAAADQLEQVAAALAGYPRGRIFEGFAESSTSGNPGAFFDNSPVLGLANPLAPPVYPKVENGIVIGEVTWGSAYEGPPGCVHGGYVAAAFDEILGLAQSLGGVPGMTGTLTIRYRRPTPLHTLMRFEGQLDRVEGRKIFCTGQLFAPDGQLTAESDGVFIRVDFGKLKELADERNRRAAEEAGDR